MIRLSKRRCSRQRGHLLLVIHKLFRLRRDRHGQCVSRKALYRISRCGNSQTDVHYAGRDQQKNRLYRTRLEQYLASMLQMKKMLSMGILTPEDYAKMDTILAEKYGISSCSLYRGIDLIYSGFRGNMSHTEEVTICQEQ